MEDVLIKSEYEIKRGKPIPSKNHAFIQTRLIVLFALKNLPYQILSELSLKIGATIKVPDLAIFENIEFTPGADEVQVTQVPLGVVEILSPKQNLTDLIVKAHAYFDHGVKSYWLVLPDLKSIYVFHKPNDSQVFSKKDILKDEELGIEIELAKVFG